MKLWSDKNLNDLAEMSDILSLPEHVIRVDELRHAAADHIRQIQQAVEEIRKKYSYDPGMEEILKRYFWPAPEKEVTGEDLGDNMIGHEW